MPTVPDIHRRGTRAEQGTLAAPPLTTGTLYFVTDEGVTERWNGTAWETYSAAAAGGGGAAANDAEYLVAVAHSGLTNERIPTNTPSVTWDFVAPGTAKASVVDGVVRPGDHAMYHETGGSDALALDRLAPPTDNTTLNASTTTHGLLPKLSGTATQFLNGVGGWTAPAGGGSGAPAAHHATHEPGGTDAIVALDAGVLTTGTVPASRLPPYSDYPEAVPANPAADVLRLYAVDFNGFSFLEQRDSTGRTLRLGRDCIAIAKIQETAGIAKGQAVYIFGATGNVRIIKLAIATSRDTTPAIGVAMESGANNTFIRVINLGVLSNLDTSAFPEGDRVFLSATTPGALTPTTPVAPNLIQRVGFCLRQHATQGELGIYPATAVSEAGWVGTHASMHAPGGRDPLPPRIGALGLVIDGGGSAITTGVKGFLSVPFACTITGWTLLSTDGSATAGSIVIDVWKDSYANYPPTVADTITASAKPTLSSVNKNTSTTLTGWTTAVAAGDVLGFSVDSATTVTKVTLSLTVQA